jgi:hypothetical protein
MPLMMPHFGPYAAPPIFYAPYGYGWGMPYMMPYAMPMPGVEVEAPSVFFRAEPLEQDMGEAEGQDGARVEGVRVFRFHALPFHAAPFHAAPYHAIPFHIAPFQGTPEVMFGIAPGMRELEEGEDVQLHRIPDAGMWMPATPAEDFELAEALEL